MGVVSGPINALLCAPYLCSRTLSLAYMFYPRVDSLRCSRILKIGEVTETETTRLPLLLPVVEKEEWNNKTIPQNATTKGKHRHTLFAESSPWKRPTKTKKIIKRKILKENYLKNQELSRIKENQCELKKTSFGFENNSRSLRLYFVGCLSVCRFAKRSCAVKWRRKKFTRLSLLLYFSDIYFVWRCRLSQSVSQSVDRSIENNVKTKKYELKQKQTNQSINEIKELLNSIFDNCLPALPSQAIAEHRANRKVWGQRWRWWR